MWILERYVDGSLSAIYPEHGNAPWGSRMNAISFLESQGVDTTKGEIGSYEYPYPQSPSTHIESHNRYSGGVELFQIVDYTDAAGTGWVLREISVHQRREQVGLADTRAGLQERYESWAGVEEKLQQEDGTF